MNTRPTHIIIDGDAIAIQPANSALEYLVTTKEVARGYGVSDVVIRRHKSEHGEELVEGKHWVVQKMNTLGGEQSVTLWTKRGVIRLGFFIRSERAKRFRDAAEDLIISHLEAQPTQPSANEAILSTLTKLAEHMTTVASTVNNLQVHHIGLSNQVNGLTRETTKLFARVNRLESATGIGRPSPEPGPVPPSMIPKRSPVVDADIQRLIMLALGGEHQGAFLVRDLVEVCERHGLLAGMISAASPESSLGTYLSRYAGRTVQGIHVSKYRHAKARRYIFSRT